MYADQFEIYHGNANPELARKIARYLGLERKAEVFQFANENIFVEDPRQRPREGRLPRPAHLAPGQPVDHGALIMIDAFWQGRRGGSRSSRSTPTGGRTRRTSPGAYHSAAHRRHDHGRRRRPGALDGPPPGPIQAFNILVDELTAVHMLSRYFIDKHRRRRGRHGPRLREACASVRGVARCAPGDHREGAWEIWTAVS